MKKLNKQTKLNVRNKKLNKRYLSLIKMLSKIFYHKYNNIIVLKNEDIYKVLKKELIILLNKLYKAFDKASKKGVLHNNLISRKKSKFGKLVNNL